MVRCPHRTAGRRPVNLSKGHRNVETHRVATSALFVILSEAKDLPSSIRLRKTLRQAQGDKAVPSLGRCFDKLSMTRPAQCDKITTSETKKASDLDWQKGSAIHRLLFLPLCQDWLGNGNAARLLWPMGGQIAPLFLCCLFQDSFITVPILPNRLLGRYRCSLPVQRSCQKQCCHC